MKNIKYLMLASCTVLLSSCLDTEPLGGTVTTEQKEEVVAQNPERLEASVAAIPAAFNTFANALGDEDNQNDIGYPAHILIFDSKGTDMVSNTDGYNWYGHALDYTDIMYNSTNTLMVWNNYYKQIFTCNNVLSNISLETTNPQLQYYAANALASRAFSYFGLVQAYQKTYKQVDPTTALAVPIVTEANQDDAAANGCPRATVEETYTQILNDLNKAIEFFDASGIQRSNKRYIDGAVARGIRARVYLVMNEWEKAAADAEFVINNSGATPYTRDEVSVPTFIEIADHAWIWGIDVNETDRVVTTAICNFPSFMGSFSYGYASAVQCWRKISKKLFAQIPTTDVRRGWFLDASGKSVNISAEQAAYLKQQKAEPYVQVKYAPYQGVVGTSTNASDIPLMRIEEMYLILAEAQAMGGNPAAGKSTLENFVKTYRDPAYSCNASSAEGVQDAVWQQRRIELWGEGFSFFDILRLNKGVDRRGHGFEASVVFNIAAGDDALIYRIPKREIEYNNKISEEQNNPVSVVPEMVEDIK